MKPKPSTIFSALGSIGPSAKSLKAGNSTAPTTIAPATRLAARKPNRITNSRPIRDISSNQEIVGWAKPPDANASGGVPTKALKVVGTAQERLCPPYALNSPSIRHRHGAERLAFAHRQFLGLGFQLPAGGEDVAAARGAHRRGIARIENIFGELFDLVPLRAFVNRAGPGIERDEIDLGRNAVEHLHQQFCIIERIVDALQHHIFEG